MAMPPEEVTCEHPAEAAPLVVDRLLTRSIRPRLVRVEGCMSAGKSALAAALVSALKGVRVEADCFDPFGDQLGTRRYQSALHDALAMDRWVITDSVRLEEIAPLGQFGRGYNVYVRRQEMFLGARCWRYGYDIDDMDHTFSGEGGLDRAIRLFHRKYRPHEIADLIVSVPDEERGPARM